MPVEVPHDSSAPPRFALEEVRAAVRALRVGAFREPGPSSVGEVLGHAPASPDPRWMPETAERVVAVVGAAGSAGASTVALAVAECSTDPARVVECCSLSDSGLVAACTAELGRHPSGWVRGTRYGVILERSGTNYPTPDVVPVPLSPAHTGDASSTLTVLDIGWHLTQLSHGSSWLAQSLRLAHLVLLVGHPTVPGMRRLESTLDLLQTVARCTASSERLRLVLVGPARKKWPRGVEGAAGPATRRLLDARPVVVVPPESRLAHAGLDTAALPESVVASVDCVVRGLGSTGARDALDHEDVGAVEPLQLSGDS